MKKSTSQRLLSLVVMMATLSITTTTYAGIAIIGHPDEATQAISKKTAAEVFLGKNNRMGDGTRIKVLDQSEENLIRDKFYESLVDKNRRQMQAYWINRIFTGRGTPPAPVGGDADVKAIISASPGYIGYIDSRNVDASVKVLLILP